jgi:hypothetical protein
MPTISFSTATVTCGDNGDPDNIDWVANEGIRASRLVAFIKGAQVREHEKALQTQFIAISSGDTASLVLAPNRVPEANSAKPVAAPRTPPPTPVQAPRPGASPAPLSAASRNGLVSLTLPFTIHIGVGTPQQHGTVAHAEVTIAADRMLEAGGSFYLTQCASSDNPCALWRKPSRQRFLQSIIL